MSSIRKEVMASIIEWMAALPDGVDALVAAGRHWPDVPGMVLAEAWTELEMQREEAWWQSIERTIDGEIIRNALAKAGGAA